MEPPWDTEARAPPLSLWAPRALQGEESIAARESSGSPQPWSRWTLSQESSCPVYQRPSCPGSLFQVPHPSSLHGESLQDWLPPGVNKHLLRSLKGPLFPGRHGSTSVSILFLPRKPRTPLPAAGTACAQERSEETGPSRDRSSALCTIVYAWPCFSSVKWGPRRKAFTSEILKSSAGRGLFDPRPRLAWDLTRQMSLPE